MTHLIILTETEQADLQDLQIGVSTLMGQIGAILATGKQRSRAPQLQNIARALDVMVAPPPPIPPEQKAVPPPDWDGRASTNGAPEYTHDESVAPTA